MNAWQKTILEKLVSDDTMESTLEKELELFHRVEHNGPFVAVIMFNSEIHSDNLKKYWHASVSFRENGKLIYPDVWDKSPMLLSKAESLFKEALHGVGTLPEIHSIVEGAFHRWREFTPEEYKMHERFLIHGN